MKIEAKYYPTIGDGPVVRFKTGFDRGLRKSIIDGEVRDWSAEVNASRKGVSMQGDWPIYGDRGAIEDLQALLDVAWYAHRLIRSNGDGHDAAKRVVAEFDELFAWQKKHPETERAEEQV